MALYLIGDLQGCDAALQKLLDKIAFSPSRDTLYLLGDLVNRGPQSEAVLRRLMGYGSAARCLLGNHDLHLLGVAYGVRQPGRKDTLAGILQASDAPVLLDWLRQQPLVMLERWGGQSLLMVHAGVLPQWSAEQTFALAGEVQAHLRANDASAFFASMYGNTPAAWCDALQGTQRLRTIVNALTRLRFCSADGVMEFETKGDANSAPPGYYPWFAVPGRKTANTCIAFGHWSTLGPLQQENLLALDTGCVWGGCLSAVCITPRQTGWDAERIQVRCESAQKPGAD
ncbi:MAG: symmetrical bis(5'-nucleosyl)-tetraphosphatase [Rhodoferax sp.]|nr:symmetrical bis(5'-nucleosyl)-tetraphosphatase [Rhodoferax sp.]